MRKLTDAERLDIALTIAGEIDPSFTPYGTYENRREIAAILGIIENRSALAQKSLHEVIHQRKQFSTWNDDAKKRIAAHNYANHKANIDKAIDDYFSGYLESPVPNATHYWAPKAMMDTTGSPEPGWGSSVLHKTRVGAHVFGHMQGEPKRLVEARNQIDPPIPTPRPDPAYDEHTYYALTREAAPKSPVSRPQTAAANYRLAARTMQQAGIPGLDGRTGGIGLRPGQDPMTTRALRQTPPETAPAPTAPPDRFGSADPSGRVRAAWDAARDDAAAAALRGLGAFAPSFAPGSPDAVDPSRYGDVPLGPGAYSPAVRSALAQAADLPDPAAISGFGTPSASPLGMGTAERNAALEAGLARQFTPDRIAANLGAARANNAAPSTGGTIPDAAARADAAISSRAWGPSPAEIEAARLSYAGQPTTAPSVQRVSDYTTSKADRLPGSIRIGGLQPLGPEATIAGTTPPDLSAITQAAQGVNEAASFAPPGGTLKTFLADLERAKPGPTIAAAEPDTPVPDQTFPDPPPRMRQIASTFQTGLQQLRQGLAQGFGSGPPTMSGPNFGSGLAAMQAATSGPPGAMAQSRSNPAYSFGKTATGGIRFGPKGWQALDASGEQSGGLHAYDGNLGLGSYLGGLFEGLGGAFGGARTSGGRSGRGGKSSKSGKTGKKSGRDSVDRDHGRGLGAGLY